MIQTMRKTTSKVSLIISVIEVVPVWGNLFFLYVHTGTGLFEMPARAHSRKRHENRLFCDGNLQNHVKLLKSVTKTGLFVKISGMENCCAQIRAQSGLI